MEQNYNLLKNFLEKGQIPDFATVKVSELTDAGKKARNSFLNYVSQKIRERLYENLIRVNTGEGQKRREYTLKDYLYKNTFAKFEYVSTSSNVPLSKKLAILKVLTDERLKVIKSLEERIKPSKVRITRDNIKDTSKQITQKIYLEKPKSSKLLKNQIFSTTFDVNLNKTEHSKILISDMGESEDNKGDRIERIANFISHFVIPIYKSETKKTQGGVNFFLKVIFGNIETVDNSNKGVIRQSFSVNNIDSLKDDIILNLHKTNEKHFSNTMDDNIQQDSEESSSHKPVFLLGFQLVLSRLGDEGGCNSNKRYTSETITNVFGGKVEKIKLVSYPSTNNNCLFQILNQHFTTLEKYYCIIVEDKERIVKQGSKQFEAFQKQGLITTNTEFVEKETNCSIKPQTIRKEIGLKEGSLVNVSDIQKILDWYNKKFNKNFGLMLCNQRMEIILNLCPKFQERINICLRDEHYFEVKVKNMNKCKECFITYNEAEEHICDLKRKTYVQHQIKGNKKDIVISKHLKEDRLNYNQVIHLDFETLTEDNGNQVVYASGIYCENDYTCFYGKDALEKTVEFLVNQKNKIINAYNGSRFDYYMIMKELNKRGHYVKNIVNANGSLMYFEFCRGDNRQKIDEYYKTEHKLNGIRKLMIKEKNIEKRTTLSNTIKTLKTQQKKIKSELGMNKVFDLNLFLGCSLKRACADYKIKDSKKDFNHALIKQWDDVEKYKDEVLVYLKYDVLSLKELTELVNNEFYDLQKCNITSFLAIGHCAYEVWASKLKKEIEIPRDIEKYEFILGSKYGGRTHPLKQHYKSEKFDEVCKSYESIIAGFQEKLGDAYTLHFMILNSPCEIPLYKTVDWKNVELFCQQTDLLDEYTQFRIQLKSNYNNIFKSNEYVFNGDITSLYPSAMKFYKYPVGMSRWSDNPLKEYNDGKLGIYNIRFQPPKNIRVPVLPRHKLSQPKGVKSKPNKIGIQWSLNDGEGCYTNIDIDLAINSGYKIEFVGKALIWDESDDVFGDYIEEFYKVKADAEKLNNLAKRNLAKIFLNSLYGKMLQKAHFDETITVDNIFDYNKFFRESYVSDIKFMSFTGGSDKILMTGRKKEIESTKCINKPTQLGCFVLSYSRKIMMDIFKAIDPSLTTPVFNYTDTDSAHMTGLSHKRLKELGMIVEDSQLGKMCNDYKNGELIIQEYLYAPKSYTTDTIDVDGIVKLGCSLKAKGIPLKNTLGNGEVLLERSDYNSHTPKTIQYQSFQKKHHKLNSNDIKNGVDYYSIIKKDCVRTFLKNQWTGMDLKDNEYYPYGYILNNGKPNENYC